MSNHEGCPFCDVDDRVLVENEHANLFLSNPRKVEGHILVTPKRHIEMPWKMSDMELLAVFSLIKIAQSKLIAKYGSGCDIKQNYRPFMKQDRLKVDHTHYHVYPRTNEDELYQQVEKYETHLFTELSNEERAKVSSLFE